MSGHKNGNNSNNYKDTHSCPSSYRAAKIWSGHENMQMPLKVPKPHWLENPAIKPEFDRLYRVAFFTYKVFDFEVEGRLYHFGQYLLCMPIKWYVTFETGLEMPTV